MSWLTQFMRGIGLGSVLDTIEAAEKSPTPQTIAAAVSSGVGAIATAPDVAIEALGTMAGNLVVETANRVLPGTGTLAAPVVSGFMQKLEALAETELSALTGGFIHPPAAVPALTSTSAGETGAPSGAATGAPVSMEPVPNP